MQETVTVLKRFLLFTLLQTVNSYACQQRVGKEACGERETVLHNAAVFRYADARGGYVTG